MNFALIENDQVVSTNLPQVGTLADGSPVSGFNKLDPEILAELGWLPIVDDGPPEYDTATQSVSQVFAIEESQVVVVYTVNELPEPIPTPDPGPTDIERLQAKDDSLQALADSMLTDMLTVFDILINNGLI